MICGQCKTENPDGLKFCNECGAAFRRQCASCGFENVLSAKFCGRCGAGISRDSAPSAKTSDAPIRLADIQSSKNIDGERKTVTALFSDIKGSMELMEDLDPEEARAFVDPALKLMIEAVQHYGGFVVQSTGDGIFALFGAPIAHEDHPQRALYSALRMQEAMRHYGERLRADKGLNLQLRIGVNVGEVVVRTVQTGEKTEYSPIGHSTSLAARLQTLATPGSTVITGTMRGLVEGYFQLKGLGPTRIKGVSEPVELFEVTGMGALRTRLQRAAARGLTKFVGREREMDTLRNALEEAKAGHGQIVAAIGEPGVGKSRLCYEFKAISSAGCLLLEAVSVSHGKASAYQPVIDLLHGYFEITPDDDGRKRREKVGGKVLMLDRTLEDALPYLFSLLGITDAPDPLTQIDGQAKKRRTLEAIKRVLLRESLNQPLILMFEDLHWIDTETQQLLNLIADAIANAHILLMVNYRPEYHHEWGNRSHYFQLRLDPLGSQSAAEMLSELLGDAPELGPIKRTIIEKTEGNPFFIEELVQGLFDEGVLVRNGTVKVGRSLAQLRLPPTAQAVLAARIDRLSPEQKELLQTLAVVGREFPMGLVRRVAQLSDAELDRMLNDLQLAEFVLEQPAFPETEYIFKHALTREVAYNSILMERRKQIHERAAEAIETLFESNLAEHYADLAHQYARSGNGTKGLKYLRLAAEQAIDRCAYSEAGVQLASALELLKAQPDSPGRDDAEITLRFHSALCITFSVAGAYTPAIEMLEPARALCKKIGDRARQCEALASLAALYANHLPDRQKARAACEELLDITRETDGPEMAGHARFWLAWTWLYEGNFRVAFDGFNRACDLAVSLPSKSELREVSFGAGWKSLAPSLLSLTLCFLGNFDDALARDAESLATARGNPSAPNALMSSLVWSALLHQLLRKPQIAYSHGAEADRLARERGVTAFLNFTAFNRGWALVQSGQIEEGLTELEPCRKVFAQVSQTYGNDTGETWFGLGLAEAYLASNRFNDGLEVVAQALETAQRTGTRIFEAEMLRLKGELLLRSGNQQAASQCFRNAVEVARRQGAKLWELRATTSLTRLLAPQGRCEEACTMLVEICNSFPEGFHAADLKDAKALLEELK
jgi:class 3 adenylate cyclase/predicted negative regulator of RcsB-dependent stress response